MRYIILALALSGCSLESWNPAKVAYIDHSSGCKRYMHSVRGPDAYDIEHNQPYHCEAPMYDSDFFDVDQVDQ